MSDYPRRRRLEPEPPKRGGIPIIPLMILVVLCGLALGGLLTKFFGAGAVATPSSAPSFTPLPEATATFTATDTPSPVAAPSLTPTHAAKTPRPLPSATLIPGTTPGPSVKPYEKPSVKPAATQKPKPRSTQVVIVLTPTPAPGHAANTPVTATATPPPVVAAPTNSPVLITGANNAEHASSIVSAYIAALERGDSATAAGYLASGLPTESFINPNVTVNVSDMRTSRNSDGSYGVTAQIVTSKGTYYTSFTLRMGPYGMQITAHNATRI